MNVMENIEKTLDNVDPDRLKGALEEMERDSTERFIQSVNIKKEEDSKLLDRFAGLALQGILSAQIDMRSSGVSHTVEGIKYLAEESYMIAKAMLKAREEALKDE